MTHHSSRIVSAGSLSELFNRDFEGRQNQISYTRSLKGNYNLLAWWLYFMEPALREQKLKEYAGMSRNEGKPRRSLLFGDAAEQILSDMAALSEAGRSSEFRVVGPSRYDSRTLSFHFDVCPDRTLFIYNEPGTETIDNEDALPHRFNDPRFAVAREGAAIYKSHAGDVIRLKALPPDCPSIPERNARFHRAPRMGIFSVPRMILLG